jgi:hypothetical protein
MRAENKKYLMLAAVSFYFLAGKYAGNRWIYLGGAFIFSILPWVFPLSRTGIGGYMPISPLSARKTGWYL